MELLIAVRNYFIPTQTRLIFMYAVTKDCKIMEYTKSNKEEMLNSGDCIYYGFYCKKDAQRWAKKESCRQKGVDFHLDDEDEWEFRND